MRRTALPVVVGAVTGFVILALLGRVSFGALGAVSGFSPAAGLAAAVVAVRWRDRYVLAPSFGVLAAAVALFSGAGAVHAWAFGSGLVVEVLLAGWLLRRSADPLDRPETAAWWALWGVAAAAGASAGAVVFLAVDRPTSGFLALGVIWLVGHGAGLALVAPGVWAAMRWTNTGGSRHRQDLRHMAAALGGISLAMLGAGVMAALSHRPEPFVVPFVVLAWLALSAGHRVTVVASSAVGTVTLLAMPWWIGLPAGISPLSATMLIVLGHVAASALAIESSARWHARALLGGVVEIATEAVLIVDGGGRVMTGNPAARALFGADLEGAAVADLIPGLRDDWSERLPSGVNVEGRDVRGQVIAVEVVVGKVDAPGRPMFTLVCRDITEIRAAAAALQRSAEIINASPDLVGWTDEHGNLMFLNSSGREMIGASDEETIDAWSAAGLLTGSAIRAASEHVTWRGEATLVTRNGLSLPVDQTVMAHRSDEGKVRYYSVLARDISERYALEQMKSEFVSNVTHELRSPLTGVIGYLGLLLDGAFGSLPEPAAEALREVDGSAHSLLELINDLLALWRAEDRGAGDLEDLDLGSVVAAAMKTMEPVAAGKRISLTLCSDDVVVVGDRRQLERAVLNVVSNAVKFTPPDGSVSVAVTATDGQARVEISDSGVGIPDTEIDAVFERFYRASTAESAGIPGTGLGLPLVREVVRSHGGDVRIESAVGVGTTFVIELPVLVAAALSAG